MLWRQSVRQAGGGGGVGKGDTASSLPDDIQGLSRWAETWSPYPGPHCDSQQVTREHHWKSISPCSLIVRKKLPCLQHHIISQDNLTFIYFCLFLSSPLSFSPSLTLSPLWDVLAGWLFGRLRNRSRLVFYFEGPVWYVYRKLFLINFRVLKAFVCLISVNVRLTGSSSTVVSYQQRTRARFCPLLTTRCNCSTVCAEERGMWFPTYCISHTAVPCTADSQLCWGYDLF